MEKFLNRAPGSTYYKTNGEPIIFVGGVYETSDPTEIQELKATIAADCTLIYQEVEEVVESEKVVKLVPTPVPEKPTPVPEKVLGPDDVKV